jgi:hypothetical protein
MALRRFGQEVVLAGFAAEAHAPMLVADETQLSTAACAAILQFSHDIALRLEVGHAMLSGACVNMATNSSHRPTSTASALCACRQRSAAPTLT